MPAAKRGRSDVGDVVPASWNEVPCSCFLEIHEQHSVPASCWVDLNAASRLKLVRVSDSLFEGRAASEACNLDDDSSSIASELSLTDLVELVEISDDDIADFRSESLTSCDPPQASPSLTSAPTTGTTIEFTFVLSPISKPEVSYSCPSVPSWGACR